MRRALTIICPSLSTSPFWSPVSAACCAAGSGSGRLQRENTYTFGDKLVDFNLLQLQVRGQVFPLTLMEANVLRYLIRHENQPVPRKKMLEDVWGLHEDTDTRAIDNFIVRLRRYIEDDPTKPRHVLTLRGIGYRLVSQSQPRRR